MKVVKLLPILLVFLLINCTEPIKLDLKNQESYLVIEGWITKNDTTPKWVRLSYSKPYFDENNFPGLSNALVIVRDNVSQIDTFSWNDSLQRYEATTLKGIPERTYRLEVHYNNRTYTAETFLPNSIPLDTVVFIQIEENLLLEKGYRPVIVVKEPDTLGNFYRIRLFKNDTLQGFPPKDVITDDQFFNGNQLFLPLPYSLQKDDTCLIELSFIDKKNYDFFNSIHWQLGSDGIYTPPPVDIISNIKSSDGSKVYGWFGALANEYYFSIVK